jgi:hypothetical protein
MPPRGGHSVSCVRTASAAQSGTTWRGGRGAPRAAIGRPAHDLVDAGKVPGRIGRTRTLRVRPESPAGSNVRFHPLGK